MLKILQVRLQQDMNWEHADFQAGFRKGRGTRGQIANIRWIIEKSREFQQKHLFLLSWLCTVCVEHNKLWKILEVMRIPDHLTCLLRKLYAGKQTSFKTQHGIMDWLQIGKGVCQVCILSPCFFNLYSENIMWNARLDEVQAGIKMSGRNVYHLRYADDITLMAEREEELRSLLLRVKEESEKAGLKLNIQKTKIVASGPITSWQRDGETMETFRGYFLGLQNHCRWWLQPWN